MIHFPNDFAEWEGFLFKLSMFIVFGVLLAEFVWEKIAGPVTAFT